MGARTLHTVTVDLQELSISPLTLRIRRNGRARHVRLSVEETGEVIASVPKRFPLQDLEPIVRNRAGWLEQTIRTASAAHRATQVDLARGGPAPYLGQRLPVELTQARRSSVELVDQTIAIALREDDDPYAVLERWYRNQARSIIEQRIDHFSAEHGFTVRSVAIRNQRTRWGSCNSRGDLSFNWRLVLAPMWVLDSIVAHELCHLVELNHSSRFWGLLDEVYPDHRQARVWLASHGATLRVSRPAAPVEDEQVLALF